MPKLIIQIPCYNEEATLGVTLSALPRKLPGIDAVEWLVIDDGSTDRTDRGGQRPRRRPPGRLSPQPGPGPRIHGRARGVLRAGADIIVNTDADNQYCADDIPKLVEPILAGQAAIVVGARPIGEIAHFSRIKKWLQQLGSWVVRLASSTDIPDAPSGFRAMSRDAAIQLNVFDDYHLHPRDRSSRRDRRASPSPGSRSGSTGRRGRRACSGGCPRTWRDRSSRSSASS